MPHVASTWYGPNILSVSNSVDRKFPINVGEVLAPSLGIGNTNRKHRGGCRNGRIQQPFSGNMVNLPLTLSFHRYLRIYP